MDVYGALASFAAIVALLTLTPGLDTALILRTSLLAGRRSAWAVVLGIQGGTLSWGMLTAAGLSALLTASQVAYEVLRWAGVAYLIWMGARMLWHSRTSQGDDAAPPGPPEAGWGRAFRRGLLTNLLNPKVGAFYVAVLPQFMPRGVPHAVMGVLLAGVHVCEALVWSAVLIGFTGMVRGWLRRPPVGRALDRLTGLVVIGFGLRLAIQQS
ncbi:LysE family translocator [Microbispora bryophytorum]|uniref:Lysine transporter LysE n=1 Tax=Microbispora bryophytorum TaxID=1460882 RepID=A0A8H9LHF8_9ACTN|nr:LysE family translocator [Microbispora bryophytorum]MBD3140125.1 LysE family translocator [Microbispora bryophytorum]TQS04884.1 LysE family translocator [Microbispora bryophytorum]GGO16339.1 lysine transporter LysE [Microbispora bryophytorum]